MPDFRPTATGVVQRFKRPAYTGSNRCGKYAALNAGLAFLLVTLTANVSLPAALLLLIVSAITITYRGYLVPGTPLLVRTLTDRIETAILAVSSQQSAISEQSEALDHGTPAVETVLGTGRVTFDDLTLTESFRETWRTRMDDLRSDGAQRTQLARSLSVPPEEISFEERTRGVTVRIDGRYVGRWRSRAAFIADLASEALLDERLADWDDLPARDRMQLLASLRALLEACPSCGGEVVTEKQQDRSWRRDERVWLTTACVECDAVLFDGVVD